MDSTLNYSALGLASLDANHKVDGKWMPQYNFIIPWIEIGAISEPKKTTL